MKLIQHPNDALRTKCSSVEIFDEQLKEKCDILIKSLKEMRKSFIPVEGLAANQIGYFDRIVAFKLPLNKYFILVNPVVVKSHLTFPSFEVCGSLPGKIRFKWRKWAIKIRYKNVKGLAKEMTLYDTASFLFQQEMDHLDGKLIID